MRLFFAGTRRRSVTEAKNRLKSVINNDRINITQSKTLEKMKKEVSAVLAKYCTSVPPQVSVTCQSGALCVLSATVTIEKETA